MGENHGFDATISVSVTGTQTVYVYACNVGGGTNVLIGTKTVTIKSDNTNTSSQNNSSLAQPIKLTNARWSTSTANNAGCQHDVQASNIMNQPVYAIADGTISCKQIVSSSYGGKLVSYGNVIYFTSSDGRTKATYAHLNGFAKCNAKVASYYSIQKSQSACNSVQRIDLGSYNVKKGEVIGYVGTTGNSTGAHLHFELYIDGVRKNPPDYVKIN